MENQLYKLVVKLLSRNNIYIHKEELKLQIASHPSYPSLHAVTGVLDHFNIENVALKIPTTAHSLLQCPDTFFAVIETHSGQSLALVIKNSSRIKLIHQNEEVEKLTAQDFLLKWNGIIIAIDKEEKVNKKGVSSTKHILGYTGILLFLLVVSPMLFQESWALKIHLLLSFVGFFISLLIINKELGIVSKTVDKFCNLTEKTSCALIFESAGSEIIKGVKLSDICLITFSTFSFGHILLFYGNFEITTILKFLSLASLPFVVFSLYYQKFVAKSWCPLCLGIVSVLLLQLGSLWFGSVNTEGISFHHTSVIAFTISSFLMVTSWYFLKPLLKNKEKLFTLEVNHHKFKRNYAVFNSLVAQETELTNYTKIPNEIVLGNPNAPIHLTLVTSPLCYYCKDAHKDILYVLNNAKDSIQVAIRFLVKSTDKESILYKVVSELLHVYHTKSQKEFIELFNQVYADHVDVAAWVASKNIHFNIGYDKVMDSQYAWSQENNINFTPALYLNGKQFPKEYDRKDLLLFIEDIIEREDSPIHLNKSIVASA